MWEQIEDSSVVKIALILGYTFIKESSVANDLNIIVTWFENYETKARALSKEEIDQELVKWLTEAYHLKDKAWFVRILLF